ncbi:MAG: hypothetical protein HY225_00920 [Candidatus Vogelbacteria bacterium]|nr:hypothetical protein [Candidatus Vogelbacteria bacterium]
MYHNINEKCSIIVSSCDAYSDVWPVFFTLFFRYWPDCPFPVYLVAENKVYPDKRVKTIIVGKDKSWATNTKKAVRHIVTPYILNLFEDFLFTQKINTEEIANLLELTKKENAACLKLDPRPWPDKKFKNYKEIGEVSKNVNYSVSLLSGFWDKKIFESLLKDGETAWQMEIDGSKRAINIMEPFLSTYERPLHCFYSTAIKKGKWFYDAVLFCEREGIAIDKQSRSIETKKDYYLRNISHLPAIGRPFSFLMRQLKKII